jgi:hypothetical protein
MTQLDELLKGNEKLQGIISSLVEKLRWKRLDSPERDGEIVVVQLDNPRSEIPIYEILLETVFSKDLSEKEKEEIYNWCYVKVDNHDVINV